MISGCNKQCMLLSHEGVQLDSIGEEQDSWIWCCRAHPTAPFLVSIRLVPKVGELESNLIKCAIPLIYRFSVVKMGL